MDTTTEPFKLTDEAVRALGHHHFRGEDWTTTFTEARNFRIGMTLTDAFDGVYAGAIAEGHDESIARYRAVQAVSYLTSQHALACMIDAAPEDTREALREWSLRFLGKAETT